MKLIKPSTHMTKHLVSAILILSSTAVSAKTFQAGKHQLVFNDKTAEVTIISQGDTILNRNLPKWGLDSVFNGTQSISAVKASQSKISDAHGTATRVTLTGRAGADRFTQHYDLYPEYVMTDLIVESPGNTKLNYLAPISATKPFSLSKQAGNYAISIPYDNDAWVRYINTPFGSQAPESYEVAAVFNSDSRKGIVLGSIEHDIWKTGIRLATSGTASIDSMQVYSGATSNLTRDRRSHGAVNGKNVRSARMIIIPADDWRDGLEAYADQCAIFAPKIKSRGPRPFGWNSWGKLQTKINYDNAIEVSDFIRDNLQSEGFHDEDGVVYIDLDAFWDFGFNDEQHRKFVKHCRDNGQRPGIYYCPFTDWSNNPDGTVGEAPEYKMGDLYIRVNGEPVKFDGAPALDPTHPATQARIRRQLEQFIDWGYEYVKIDFMAHGAYEGDSHFDPAVTTGTQAYNVGMKFIDDVIDGRMWINLSIAPLFPANYAHSRRISCDSWNTIQNTEYTLNALTYGWWLDRVYHFNDADHIVYEGATDGENRARVTSSALTGVYFLGDDMSKGGLDDTKRRVVRNTANRDINAMARACGSFRPVEAATGEKAADMFVNEDDNYIYVAIFNFGENPGEKTLPLRRIGLPENRDFKAKELWSGDDATLNTSLTAFVPSKDVKVYRIEK